MRLDPQGRPPDIRHGLILRLRGTNLLICSLELFLSTTILSTTSKAPTLDLQLIGSSPDLIHE